MWFYLAPLIRRYHRWITCGTTVVIFAPLIPFGYWLYQKGTPLTLQPSVAFEPAKSVHPPFPELRSDWLSVKVRSLEELLPNFSQEVFFLGKNMRPDQIGLQKIWLAWGKEVKPFCVRSGQPFFCCFDAQKKLKICEQDDAVFECIVKDRDLKVSLVGSLSIQKSFFLVEKKIPNDMDRLRLVKEELLKWKYLGPDQIKEHFSKSAAKIQPRIFDPIHQTLYVLAQNDLFYLKDGVLKFFTKKEAAKDLILCKLQAVLDSGVQITLWDVNGYFSETIHLPLEKGEKLGTRVQSLIQTCKPFGYQTVWLKKPLRMAFTVGQWLMEENGDWVRPTKERLEDAIEGRIKANLIFFSSLNKEQGKWLAELDVFDSLHVQKETIRVTLDSKVLQAAVQGSKPSAKSEQKEIKKDLPPPIGGAVNPMLDDFDDDDLEDF